MGVGCSSRPDMGQRCGAGCDAGDGTNTIAAALQMEAAALAGAHEQLVRGPWGRLR